MKKEEINDLFILNYFYATPESTKINGHKTLNIPNDIQEYLNNRFNDSESNKETIMRIKYGIENRPLCPVCNKPVRWFGHKATRLFFNTCCHEHEVLVRKLNIKKAVLEKYGVDNVFLLEDVKEKSKLTHIKNYGVDNPQKCKEIKERTENTCYKKYRHRNFGGGELAKKKIQLSLIKRFGSKENLNKHITKKCKETKLQLYGNETYNNMEKNIQTCMNNYGVPYYFLSLDRRNRFEEFLRKRVKTMRKNHTWVLSKSEAYIYNIILRKIFDKGDIICLYRSELYPFNCDFYIKSLDLYIEYLGMWTHGGHPFDENNENDLKRLEYMKSKNSGYYLNAIETWTIRDINKRNIAKLNNLNYLEIFSKNVDDVIKQFNIYLNENKRKDY